MANPKVLVGIPVADAYEYCLEESLAGLQTLAYDNYDVLFVDNSKNDNYYYKLKGRGLNVIKAKYFQEARDRMVDSRNILRKYALDNNYDYLLSLDADIVVTKDVITRLLAHNKDVVSAVYFRELRSKKGTVKILPLILVLDEKDPTKLKAVEDIKTPRLIEIAMCGLGCVLIHRKVLEKVEFRYEKKGFDDESFCIESLKHGFKIYADTGMRVKHLFLNRPWDWDHTFNIKDKTVSSPRVLVGAPISDMHSYCFDEFIAAIKNLTYKNYEIMLVDNSQTDAFYKEIKRYNVDIIKSEHTKFARERVTHGHNLLREKALRENFEYLLILDQDVIPPLNIIEKLIRHSKGVIAGLYFGHHIIDKHAQAMPFAWKFTKNEGDWSETRYINRDELVSKEPIKIAFAGGGCIFIHRSILEKIKFRYDTDMDAWDDRWLGYDVYKNGYEMFLDPTVRCQHLYLKRPFSWDEIRAKKEY